MKKLLTFFAAAPTLGLGGALMAQQIGSVSKGYIEEGNLLRPGNIIKTITMTNRQDENRCRAECDRDGRCKAYSYVIEQRGQAARCYLRLAPLPQGATRSHGHLKVVSATKLSAVKDVYRMTPYPDQIFGGGYTEVSRHLSSTIEDPMQCASMCQRNGSCVGFSYLPKGFIKQRPNEAFCRFYKNLSRTQFTAWPGTLSATKQPVPVPLQRPVPSPTRTPSVTPRLPQPAKPIPPRPN